MFSVASLNGSLPITGTYSLKMLMSQMYYSTYCYVHVLVGFVQLSTTTLHDDALLHILSCLLNCRIRNSSTVPTVKHCPERYINCPHHNAHCPRHNAHCPHHNAHCPHHNADCPHHNALTILKGRKTICPRNQALPIIGLCSTTP